MKQAKISINDLEGMTFLELEKYLVEVFGFDINAVGKWSKTKTHYYFIQESVDNV